MPLLYAGDSADNDISDQLMHLIWAFGQVFPDYNHFPNSGLESGTAGNDRFYKPDELKYHGINNRGATTINFFGKGVTHWKDIYCAVGIL